jgi:hypothetical protein
VITVTLDRTVRCVHGRSIVAVCLREDGVRVRKRTGGDGNCGVRDCDTGGKRPRGRLTVKEMEKEGEGDTQNRKTSNIVDHALWGYINYILDSAFYTKSLTRNTKQNTQSNTNSCTPTEAATQQTGVHTQQPPCPVAWSCTQVRPRAASSTSVVPRDFHTAPRVCTGNVACTVNLALIICARLRGGTHVRERESGAVLLHHILHLTHSHSLNTQTHTHTHTHTTRSSAHAASHQTSHQT